MSNVSFGIEINIPKKRVRFYNRSASAVTVYEGMPVCYMFDTTTNVLGWSKSSAAKGTTTAEGYQNEGKFLIVELPYSDNLLWFAGVVANGGYCGKTVAGYAYKWLDIYEPDNKSIIPVRASVACTTGITVLSIETDSQELTQPLSANQARPVAIAEETRALSDLTSASISAFSDYSGTVAGTVLATSTHGLSSGTTAGVKITGTASYNGVYTVTYVGSTSFYFTATFVATETGTFTANKDIVLAKLCPDAFIYQDLTGTALSVASLGTSDIVVNRINVTSAQTGGAFTALGIWATVTGTPCVSGGGFSLYTQTDISGIATGQNASVSHWTNINAGGDLSGTYFGVEIGIWESGADLTGMTAGTDIIAPLCLRYQLDATNGPGVNTQYQMYLRSEAAGSHPDGLFACYTDQAIGMAVTSSTTCTHVIPIYMVATGNLPAGVYYIMVKNAA